jgi:hypothetical protein
MNKTASTHRPHPPTPSQVTDLTNPHDDTAAHRHSGADMNLMPSIPASSGPRSTPAT